ncbi:MAG: hypothetical protein ACT4TC_24300, partial [Myxococcaceae bacterium]
GDFFFWTVHEDFPPEHIAGPGLKWPLVAVALLLGAWGLTVLARRFNQRARGGPFYTALLCAVVFSAAGAAALLAGPLSHDMKPAQHAYPATMWMLIAWTVFHVLVGVLMHLYCLARRWRRRLTPAHDIDICNVTLYWHFTALMAVVTVAVVGGFPLAV